MLLFLDVLLGVDYLIHFLQKLIVLLLFFLIRVHILEMDDFQNDIVDSIVFRQLFVIGYFDTLYDVDQVSD